MRLTVLTKVTERLRVTVSLVLVCPTNNKLRSGASNPQGTFIFSGNIRQ